MTSQPIQIAGAVQGLLEKQDPWELSKQLGMVRIGIGVTLLLAPGITARVLKSGRVNADGRTMARIAAGRDLGMGLGVLLSARRRVPGLRGWLEATALADLIDVYALVRDDAFRPWARTMQALAAAGGTISGMYLARRLKDA